MKIQKIKISDGGYCGNCIFLIFTNEDYLKCLLFQEVLPTEKDFKLDECLNQFPEGAVFKKEKK